MTAQEYTDYRPSEFYPTPDELILKMVGPHLTTFRERNYLRGNFQICDPQAGSGAILDYVTKTLKVDQKCTYAIELDAELSYTLQGKGYKVIHNDFLTYQGDYLFDLILMNPPFSSGDAHLLKAWEILRQGHIVCLLNAETINNPCTRKRRLLASIIDNHGSVEFIGKAFDSADRKTGVEVALVRLEKNEPDARFSFDFGTGAESQYEFNEDIASNQVAKNDLTAALIRQLEETKNAYAEYIKAKQKLEFYSRGLLSPSVGISKLADECYSEKQPLPHSYNNFVTALKNDAWVNIINKLGVSKFLTAGVMKDFDKFKKSQGAMDLTKENIFALIEMMVTNRNTIMERAIGDVFDTFTKYHETNRCHIEGWKTNSAWKVNRKIILPYYIECGFDGRFGINYHRWDEFADIDKVMCYLTGKDYDDFRKPVTEQKYGMKQHEVFYKLESLESAVKRYKIGDTQKTESEFFYLRCFKKGTIHIEFKDAGLWEKFNIEACRGKNWLPDESN